MLGRYYFYQLIELEMNINEALQNNFQTLTERPLREDISKVGRMEQVPAGTVLMDIGRYIKTVPLVVSGSVKIMREDDEGNEIFLYYIDSNQTCAMSLTCCLTFSQSQIRAIVEDDALIIFVPVEAMDEWMIKYPTWKNFVMQTYSHRFEELLHTIDLIAFHNMDERLISYLHEKSEKLNTMELDITHQQIAYDLNSSREAVSRLLKKLELQDRLSLSRNRIQLLDI